MDAPNTGKLVFAKCRHGVMVWPRVDTVIGKSLHLYGEFAEIQNQIMLRYVKAGDIAIDIGANLGATVLPMAKAVGENGQVLAFEPQPLMAQCLHTTLSLNEIFNVRVFSSAVADKIYWAKIPPLNINQGNNYGAFGLSNQGFQVQAINLNELELEKCAFIKIDVEGYEWKVIQGADKFLHWHRPALYLEAKKIPGTVQYLDWLMKNEWRCYWHFSFFFHSKNFRETKKNVFGQMGDINILALPKEHPQPDDMPEIRTPDED